jgi:hypothetical protein
VAVAERREPVTHAWALSVAIEHQIVAGLSRSSGRPHAGAWATQAVKMGTPANHEQVGVDQPLAACLSQ